MRGEYPRELMRPGGVNYFDLRHEKISQEVIGFAPLWISQYFLKKAEFSNGKLRCGAGEFSSLYIDLGFLDFDALESIVRLAEQGLPLCIKNKLSEPGHVKHDGYSKKLEYLFSLSNVSQNFGKVAVNPPLLAGNNIPEYWCRIENDEIFLFLANPQSKDIKYPMQYKQSYCYERKKLELFINVDGKQIEINPIFEPHQSLLYKVKLTGEVSQEDIEFIVGDSDN